MNDLDKYQSPELIPDMEQIEVHPSAKEDSLHHLFRSVLPVLRRWYVVLMTFIIISGVGAPLIWYFQRPFYITQGTIRVEPVLTTLLTGAPDRGEFTDYEIYMNSQVQIMISDRVLLRVADALAVAPADFDWQIFDADADLLMELKKALFNDKVISVSPVRRTEYLKIEMKNRNSPQAELVVNAFLRAYMDVVSSSFAGGADKTLIILEGEHDRIKKEYDRQRLEVQELAKDFGADYSLEGRQNISFKNWTAIQSKLTDLKMRKLEIQTQREVLSRPQDPNNLSMALVKERNNFINNDPYVNETIATLVELEKNLQILKQRLKPGHPDLDRHSKLITALQNKLDQYRLEAGTEFDASMVQAQKQQNDANLAQIKKSLELIGALEKDYSAQLEQEITMALDMSRRRFQIQDKREQMALDREELTKIRQRISQLEIDTRRPARISIADLANTGPPTTKRVILLAALLVGALACGLFLAFLMDKADKSVYTPEDVKRCIGIPLIGTTSDLTHVERKLLPEQVTEDYQTIRANLGLLSAGNIPHKLVVTSSGMREGKSTLAVNLATSLAQAGKRVLLIDGDMRKPEIERLLNLPNGSWGLQDVFFGLRRFEETVRSVPLSGLDVLTAGEKNTLETVELLEKPQTAECLNNFSQKYDHVIIDTPPVLAVPDALLWARMADAVVLSSFVGQTLSPALKETLKMLNQINVRVLGNVLCNVRTPSGHYRYGYNYGYGRQKGGNGDKKNRQRKKSLLVSPPQPYQNIMDDSEA